MTTQTTSTYTLLGTTDERTTCECCGKTSLKRTVAMQIADGPVVFYGTTCAAKALRSMGINSTASALTLEADAVAYAQKWLDAGRDANKIASKVWDIYGFSCSVKNGAIYIDKFAVVTAH